MLSLQSILCEGLEQKDYELRICGLTYQIKFASSEAVYQLQGCDGVCVYGINTIFIREGLPGTRRRDALLHEIGHAFLEASGLRSLLQSVYSGKDFEEYEEMLIRLFVPSFIHLIDANETKKGRSK